MNKLAVLALAILLTLGGLMWFAANNSMTQYLDSYLVQINEKLENKAVLAIEDVRTSAQQGLGEATNISLSNTKQNQPYPKVNIERLVWQFKKKTLKKETVEVNTIVIAKMDVSLERTAPATELNEIIELIKKQVNQAIAQETGLDGSNEFNLSIKKVVIENLYVTLYNDAIPVEEKISTDIELHSETLKKSHRMSVAAANVVIALIDQINLELSK